MFYRKIGISQEYQYSEILPNEELNSEEEKEKEEEEEKWEDEEKANKEKEREARQNDAAIKKATQTGAALLAAGLLALSCLGCASAPSRDSGLSSGNVGRLLARTDFPDAAKAAPEWTRDSLKTVNSLEADLQRERARANQVR